MSAGASLRENGTIVRLIPISEQRKLKKIRFYGSAALAAWRGLLAVRKSVEQRAPPAALAVLGQASFGDGHRKEPPAFLGTQRRPLAADDRDLLLARGLGGPGKHAQLFAEQPIHEISARVPPAR